MQTQTQTFKSWDGAELFYRSWLPAKPTEKALLLFHRGHEHSARWQETVAALGLDDVAVFAWDARGHGHSPGERGSAANLGVVIRDVEAGKLLVIEINLKPVSQHRDPQTIPRAGRGLEIQRHKTQEFYFSVRRVTRNSTCHSSLPAPGPGGWTRKH